MNKRFVKNSELSLNINSNSHFELVVTRYTSVSQVVITLKYSLC